MAHSNADPRALAHLVRAGNLPTCIRRTCAGCSGGLARETRAARKTLSRPLCRARCWLSLLHRQRIAKSNRRSDPPHSTPRLCHYAARPLGSARSCHAARRFLWRQGLQLAESAGARDAAPRRIADICSALAFGFAARTSVAADL